MAPTFFVSEPHPSVPADKKSPRISSGRGGAGNIAKYNRANLTAGPSASGPASRFSISAASTASTPNAASAAPAAADRKVFSGIGGAGNAKPASERRIFSFDEELERQQKLTENANATPIYHVGRGGAGNAYAHAQQRKASSAASVSSAGSAGSGVERAKKSIEGVRERVARAFSRE